jgi:hypothetical protein
MHALTCCVHAAYHHASNPLPASRSKNQCSVQQSSGAIVRLGSVSWLVSSPGHGQVGACCKEMQHTGAAVVEHCRVCCSGCCSGVTSGSNQQWLLPQLCTGCCFESTPWHGDGTGMMRHLLVMLHHSVFLSCRHTGGHVTQGMCRSMQASRQLRSSHLHSQAGCQHACCCAGSRECAATALQQWMYCPASTLAMAPSQGPESGPSSKSSVHLHACSRLCTQPINPSVDGTHWLTSRIPSSIGSQRRSPFAALTQ